MAEPNKPIFSASKQQLIEYAKKSHELRRSPELKKARAERELILKRFENGEWVKDIANEYHVSAQAIYRIIKSDG